MDTNDESRIIAMLREGKGYTEISRVLGVSPVKVSIVASRLGKGSSSSASGRVNGLAQRLATPMVSTANGRYDVVIGLAEDGSKVFWNPAESPNPHMLVVGESGFGKTYSIIGMICELSKAGVSSVVVDYSRGYEPSVFPSSLIRSGKVREVDIASSGIALNPLQIRASDVRGPLSVAVRIASAFKRLYKSMGVHQQQLIREIVLETYAARGIRESDRSTWSRAAPHLSEFYNRLRTVAEDEEDPRRKNAAQTHSHISSFFAFNSFSPDGIMFDWEEAISSGKVIVLQLKGLDGVVQKVVTEFLLWDIYGYVSSKEQGELRCMLVLDEAHNLSFAEEAPVDKVIREGRKFGLGAIIASQKTSDFSSGAVIDNTATKVLFRVGDLTGNFVNRLAAAGGVSTNVIKNTVMSLQKSEAFVVTNNEATVCQVPSFDRRGLQ